MRLIYQVIYFQTPEAKVEVRVDARVPGWRTSRLAAPPLAS